MNWQHNIEAMCVYAETYSANLNANNPSGCEPVGSIEADNTNNNNNIGHHIEVENDSGLLLLLLL